MKAKHSLPRRTRRRRYQHDPLLEALASLHRAYLVYMNTGATTNAGAIVMRDFVMALHREELAADELDGTLTILGRALGEPAEGVRLN